MAAMNPDSPLLDSHDDLVFGFSTPSVRLEVPGRSQGSNEAGLESGVDRPIPSTLCYTVDFKMRLRKGRLMKIADETIDNIKVAPDLCWGETLRFKLANKANEKLPEPEYEHRETIITVSTSRRGEPPFKPPPFSGSDIDWTDIEDKLRSWSDPKHKLRIEFLAIYECLKVVTEKVGRGATKKHTAALNKLVAGQQAAGTGAGAVWQEVYQLFSCTSSSCTNVGFYCWIQNGKHYKLDDKILDQLIDHAVEGMALKTHADVPYRIREQAIARAEEAMQRKKRRATAVELDPCSTNCRDGNADVPPYRLNLPMPPNEAIQSFSDWLSEKTTNDDWKEAYQATAATALKLGYDLEWLHNNKTIGAGIFKENGIMPGIAEQFVHKIMIWVDAINTE